MIPYRDILKKTCSSSATCSSCHTAVTLTSTTINALLKFPCSSSATCSSSHTAVTLLHYYKNCAQKQSHVVVEDIFITYD
jgi:hypothetical protein